MLLTSQKYPVGDDPGAIGSARSPAIAVCSSRYYRLPAKNRRPMPAAAATPPPIKYSIVRSL
jgi:hypothetical protein